MQRTSRVGRGRRTVGSSEGGARCLGESRSVRTSVSEGLVLPWAMSCPPPRTTLVSARGHPVNSRFDDSMLARFFERQRDDRPVCPATRGEIGAGQRRLAQTATRRWAFPKVRTRPRAPAGRRAGEGSVRSAGEAIPPGTGAVPFLLIKREAQLCGAEFLQQQSGSEESRLGGGARW